MNKVYTRINWKNYPSVDTAVNESNLNRMDYALDEIDKRVVEHDTTKANVASLNNLIDDWIIDETTGVITIHKVSGEQIIFDLNIEKVPVGFSMTDDGILIMTTEDGTEFTANIGSMIPVLTFNDSEQIAVSVSGEGVNKTYTFTIKTGSITEDKLQPNFLADCRLYAGNAENSATLAGEYAQQAKESAESISNNASDIVFDDTTSQLGADDVQGAIDEIVDIITPEFITKSGGAKSIPNATATNTNSIPITRGVWYVAANVRWDALNSSGVRNIYIIGSETASDGTASNEGSMDRLIGTIHGTDKAYETQVVHGIIRSNSEKNLYLHVYQNSGSTLETSYNILVAYKLSDLFV